ncbi:MAG: hypothetical protein DRP97_02770, partial [Candidatus Latescibacterota bacterium]
MKKAYCFAIALVGIVCVMATPVFAQVTWTGSGGDDNWNTGSNWSSGSVPTSTDSVLIDAAAKVYIKSSNAVCKALTLTSGDSLFM